MGCDIHLYVEKLENEECEEMKDKLPWREIYKPANIKPDWSRAGWDENYYGFRTRNYVLFAILADVRNYGASHIPIAPAKGLPKDCSPLVAEKNKQLDTDGHSHSWLTLQELIDYDWDHLPNVRDWCGEFINTTMERLKELGDDYNNIRIVIWFDN